MADVMLIKYDAGSPAAKTIERILKATNGTKASEAFAYSITIADYLTQLTAAGRKVLVQNEDGKYQELALDKIIPPTQAPK